MQGWVGLYVCVQRVTVTGLVHWAAAVTSCRVSVDDNDNFVQNGCRAESGCVCCVQRVTVTGLVRWAAAVTSRPASVGAAKTTAVVRVPSVPRATTTTPPASVRITTACMSFTPSHSPHSQEGCRAELAMCICVSSLTDSWDIHTHTHTHTDTHTKSHMLLNVLITLSTVRLPLAWVIRMLGVLGPNSQPVLGYIRREHLW